MKETTWSRVRRFAREDDGTVMLEACIWVPFFFSFFVLVLDATSLFMNESRVQRIVQDGNRQYVTGVFKSAGDPKAALELWIETTLMPIAPSAEAVASIDSSTGILTTRVSYPASETDLTGVTGAFGGLTMRVQAVHQTES